MRAAKLGASSRTPDFDHYEPHGVSLPIDFDVVVVPHLLVYGYSADIHVQGASFMRESTMFHLHHQGTAEERLWRAVIAKTLEEWICGPLSFSRKAEKFLFEDDHDFRAVCSSAGMDPERLRNRLLTIRARGVQKEVGALFRRPNRKVNLPNYHGWGQRAFGV